MGCNSCKKKKGVASSSTKDFIEKVDIKQSPIGSRIFITFVKSLIFILGVIIGIPIVIPFTVYMLFKVIFFNQGVDVTTGLVNIGKMLQKKDEDDFDEDEDISDFEEDELVMMDVDDITEENRS